MGFFSLLLRKTVCCLSRFSLNLPIGLFLFFQLVVNKIFKASFPEDLQFTLRRFSRAMIGLRGFFALQREVFFSVREEDFCVVLFSSFFFFFLCKGRGKKSLMLLCTKRMCDSSTGKEINSSF